jgi:hypothetical protein
LFDGLDQESMCCARQPSAVTLAHRAAQLGKMWADWSTKARDIMAAAALIRKSNGKAE